VRAADRRRHAVKHGGGVRDPFTTVRVHTGSDAAGLTHALGARAFTTGSDIFFGAGEYRPGSGGGQRLLVHELAHTLQQSGEAQRATVIRRAPYLHNADGLIYKDTTNDALEIAFLGSVVGVDHLFVEYRAVEAVKRIVMDLLPKGGPIRNERPALKTPYSRPTSKAGGRGSKQKKKPGGLDFGEEWGSVNEKVRGAMSGKNRGREDRSLRNSLELALGEIYAWLGGDEWATITSDLTAARLATVVMRIVEMGPQSLPLGGGSRLPAPRGKLYVAPPMLRARVLEILGVAPEQQVAYENVELEGITDPDVYLQTYEERVAKGGNVFQTGSAETGTWMFYVSEVTTRRSDNSRIQISGAVLGDTDLASLDDTTHAEVIRTMAARYGRLVKATADSGWVPGTEMAASRDRGEGQALAMENWNALGAAAYANRFMATSYDLNQNWEWLHLRGAQIGGVTAGGNLVPGLYASNSCMIPFEAMIKNWSVAGPKNFWARFIATGVNGPFATGIELWIEAKGHDQLGDLPAKLLARFDPIAGRVVDKLAGEIIKRSTDRTVRI
jgi:Domain of unknown function (DUF4157)